MDMILSQNYTEWLEELKNYPPMLVHFKLYMPTYCARDIEYMHTQYCTCAFLSGAEVGTPETNLHILKSK